MIIFYVFLLVLLMGGIDTWLEFAVEQDFSVEFVTCVTILGGTLVTVFISNFIL